MAAAMAATAVDTARGRLRLMPRLSPATATDAAMAATDAVVVMEVMAVDTAMARGRLRPVTVMAAAMVAMVAAAMVATVMAVATATGVSYHRRRRSELSQKQNRTKIVIVKAVKT